MAKKSQKISKKPMVSSISSKMKSSVYESSSDTKVSTPEEIMNRKSTFLRILDKATEQFMQNLEENKIDLTTTLDLERLVKVTLLVSGEADSISGKSGKETVQEFESSSALPIEKIDQILNLDDPSVKEMYNKLFESYNKMNDKGE